MKEYSYTDTVILDVKDVSLVLDDKLILRDINLEIKDVVRPDITTGQIVGLLGPSGRGKTQLFKILSGLRKPTTGSVTIMGKPVNPGDVGVVAQSYPLMMHRTVMGNLMLAAKKVMSNKKDAKEKIMFYLEKFGLPDKAKSYPAQLSGGQRQRIAIIQQLMCSGNFLLLDEPFSGLDVNMIDKTCETILEVANIDDLNTVIIVSHDYISTSAISNNLWFLGYEFDDKHDPMPGATIKYYEDLMQRGLSWDYPGIFNRPDFNDFTKKVRGIFNNL